MKEFESTVALQQDLERSKVNVIFDILVLLVSI